MTPEAAKWIVTFGRVGLLRPMPGTWGSLAALPFAWMLHVAFGAVAVLVFALAAFLVGWWATKVYLASTGGEDPSEVVIDEVAGQALLLAWLVPTWQGYLLGFLLFRAFDIVKPWPISVADRRIKNAFGVMFDDILAALYPVLILRAMLAYSPRAAEWFEALVGL